MRAHWRDRTKDQSDQGEGKGYVQYSALQEATKDNGNGPERCSMYCLNTVPRGAVLAARFDRLVADSLF